jgi:hypothetical protein
MRNLQLPLATRWQSLIPGMLLFLDNKEVIYFMDFMAVGITQSEEAGKYLHLYACEVIALFKLRPEAPEPMPGQESSLVMQLRFIEGIATAFFSNHFSLVCQADPRFGLP